MSHTEKRTAAQLASTNVKAISAVKNSKATATKLQDKPVLRTGRVRYKVKPATSVLRRKASATSSRSGGSVLTHSHHRKGRAEQYIAVDVPALGIAARTKNLIEFFGNQSAVAEIFQVHRGQPGRWATGQESPSIENQRRVIGMDHVVELASLIWTENVARDWLDGSNVHLDGARPIDVLTMEGPVRVLEALEAALEGSYS